MYTRIDRGARGCGCGECDEAFLTAQILMRRPADHAAAAIAAAAYVSSVPCDFVFDDTLAIVDNADVRPGSDLRHLRDFGGGPSPRKLLKCVQALPS